MLITPEVDAHECQNMAKFDIPGAYIHIEIEKDVIMLLEVALDEIMMKVTPNIYQKYSIISIKGKPLLYFQIKKALYGLLYSVLLL